MFDIIAAILITVIMYSISFFEFPHYYSAISMVLLLFIFIFQYSLSKKWVDNAIKSYINKQSGSTFDLSNNVLELIKKQKDQIEHQLIAIKNCVNIIENIKNSSGKTKQIAENVEENANKSL